MEALKTQLKEANESSKHDLAKTESLADEKERLEGTVASLESRLKTSQSELLKTNKKFEEMKEESNSTLTDNDDGKVSRVGESNKMKDVEDSFKDKYSKLVPLAIKLKKKTVDLERVIKELQSKNSKAVKMQMMTPMISKPK